MVPALWPNPGVKSEVFSLEFPLTLSIKSPRDMLLAVFVMAATACAGEQTGPGLGIAWTAGQATLNITGPTGMLVSVQGSTNLAGTNAWTTLKHLTVPAGGAGTWSDPGSAARGSQCYRLQIPQLRGIWADAFHNGLQNAAQIDQMRLTR